MEPTNIASGNNIHIENALEAELVELRLEGKSEQKSRSGKNELNLKDIKQQSNCTVVVDDEKLTVTATGTGNPAVVINCSLEAGEYYLHLDKPVSDFNVLFYNNSGTKIGSNINTSNTFTLSEKAATMRINSGISAGNYNLPFESLYINIGNTDLGYEQYGASPSPEFPSPIENVEGWNKFSGWIKNKSLNSNTGAESTFEQGAVSDYIPVNFNKNPNYYLHGLINTLNSFVCAYNSNKEFLGRTGGLGRTEILLTKELFVQGTAQGSGDIAYLRTTIYKLANNTGTVDDIDNLKTQLVEGSEEKLYAPFNSLAIEDIGKNYFDASKINNSNIVVSDNGKTITMPVGTSGNGYTTTNRALKQLCPELKVGDIVTLRFNRNLGYGYNYHIHLAGITYTWVINTELTITQEALDSIVILYGNNFTNGETGQVILTDFSIMKSTETDTTWEPYKSQTEYFPLAENQKLMQGSYISDTGIHHRRKQIVLDGTENWINFNERTNTVRAEIIITDMINIGNKIGLNLICSHFKPDDIYNRDAVGIEQVFNRLFIRINKSELSEVSLEGFKAYLAEQYANGTPVVFEYELVKEVIEPFTTEQQTAWNNIKAIKLFERSKQYYFKCNIES